MERALGIPSEVLQKSNDGISITHFPFAIQLASAPASTSAVVDAPEIGAIL